MRILVTGWFSFLHGETTAGDVLALQAVLDDLDRHRLPYDVAWSPVFRPGALTLDDASPDHFTDLIFVCGPVHGEQVRSLHARYARCRRIAIGVTVIDPADAAVTGFDLVLARDGTGEVSRRDLAAYADTGTPTMPVAGVILATGQGEYGSRRRHEEVTRDLTGWLGGRERALLELDTRLDSNDWRLCSTPRAFAALLGRLDVLVTTRLHGLVLGLCHGVPVLAVDPVEGGGKVTAQASVWDWPVLPARQAADATALDRLWQWCLSADGRSEAQLRRAVRQPDTLLPQLMSVFGV
jgi:hypothetical protein